MSNILNVLAESAKHLMENDDALKAAKIGRHLMNNEFALSEEELISLGIIKGEEVPTYESKDYKN